MCSSQLLLKHAMSSKQVSPIDRSWNISSITFCKIGRARHPRWHATKAIWSDNGWCYSFTFASERFKTPIWSWSILNTSTFRISFFFTGVAPGSTSRCIFVWDRHQGPHWTTFRSLQLVFKSLRCAAVKSYFAFLISVAKQAILSGFSSSKSIKPSLISDRF